MLHTLPTIVKKSQRRLGQGHGTGRVKTSGRGTKGQKARSKISRTFEGGALSLIKRLPFRRGKGKNKGLSIKSFGIAVGKLSELPSKAIVTEALLIEKKIVDAATVKRHGIKILGGGKLTNELTIKVPISKNAAAVIEKAGGSIEHT